MATQKDNKFKPCNPADKNELTDIKEFRARLLRDFTSSLQELSGPTITLQHTDGRIERVYVH